MNLSPEVKIYMQDYRKALEKELSYVKANNWSVDENVFSRGKKEERQRLITNRNIEKLKYFAGISEDQRGFKTVKTFIELLKEFADIYITRFDRCSELYDWTLYEETYKHLPPVDIEKKIDAEIEFQSEVLSVVNRLRINLQKLNLEGETIIEVPIYGDVPVPFLLRKKLEKLYPDLKDYVEKKE